MQRAESALEVNRLSIPREPGSGPVRAIEEFIEGRREIVGVFSSLFLCFLLATERNPESKRVHIEAGVLWDRAGPMGNVVTTFMGRRVPRGFHEPACFRRRKVSLCERISNPRPTATPFPLRYLKIASPRDDSAAIFLLFS